MELSKEQINRIDAFLKSQKVRHLDLRLELIDYLSTEIEDHLKRVAVPSFDEAFTLIERKYATALLVTIRDQKRKSLDTLWRSKFNSFWKSYFTLPRIVITLLIFTLFISLRDLPYKSSSLLTLINMILCCMGLIAALFIQFKSLLGKRTFLISETFAQELMLPFMVLTFIHQIEPFWGIEAHGNWWVILPLCFSNTIFLIGLVGTFTTFRNWLKEEVAKAYPLIHSIN